MPSQKESISPNLGKPCLYNGLAICNLELKPHTYELGLQKECFENKNWYLECLNIELKLKP